MLYDDSQWTNVNPFNPPRSGTEVRYDYYSNRDILIGDIEPNWKLGRYYKVNQDLSHSVLTSSGVIQSFNIVELLKDI